MQITYTYLILFCHASASRHVVGHTATLTGFIVYNHYTTESTPQSSTKTLTIPQNNDTITEDTTSHIVPTEAIVPTNKIKTTPPTQKPYPVKEQPKPVIPKGSSGTSVKVSGNETVAGSNKPTMNNGNSSKKIEEKPNKNGDAVGGKNTNVKR